MNKKVKTTALALALAGVLGLGSTLAYFSSNLGEKTNTFTMGPGTSGELDEPSWDEKNATNYYPGKVIAKDPTIYNKGGIEVYAMATLQYQMYDKESGWIDVSYDDLDKFINIKSGVNKDQDGFDAGWTVRLDKQVAYYNEKLPVGPSETTPLFTAVEIDPLALTPEQVASVDTDRVQFDKTQYQVVDADNKITYNYTEYQMSDFKIIVKGYIVQADGFGSCQEAMTAAFPDVVKAK